MLNSYYTGNNEVSKTQNIKYQGDDIILHIKLKSTQGDYVDLSLFDDIIIYLYTDYEDIVVKGAIVPQTGYVTLNYIDEYTYEFVVDSSLTTDMAPGGIIMEMNFITDTVNPDILDGEFNKIVVSQPLFNLLPSNIKIES